MSGEMNSTLLQVSGVSVRFGGLRALDLVSLSVEEGERRAIIGPNGAGKTTLFNVIGGTIRPSAGRVALRGRDLRGLRPNRIRRMGVSRAFQTASVFPALTVRQNIWLGMLFDQALRWNLFASAAKKAAWDEVEGMAALVGLEDLLDEVAGNLSHADQKLLDIAIALGSRPKVILLDEPTQGVSPDEVVRITSVISRPFEGAALVMIEHDIATVLEVATRVTVLDRGAVIAEGTPAEIGRNEDVQSVYLGQELAEMMAQG
jgi:branched-chain amino acid transport system ATP-binding protein